MKAPLKKWVSIGSTSATYVTPIKNKDGRNLYFYLILGTTVGTVSFHLDFCSNSGWNVRDLNKTGEELIKNFEKKAAYHKQWVLTDFINNYNLYI